MKVLLYLDRPDELDTDIEMYPMPVQRPFLREASERNSDKSCELNILSIQVKPVVSKFVRAVPMSSQFQSERYRVFGICCPGDIITEVMLLDLFV